MVTRRNGSMVTAVTAVVRGLGRLQGEQVTLAASALLLARDLDDGRGVSENVARELRITMRELVVLSHAAGHVGVADPIAALQDEVARKRAQREAGA